MTNNVQSDISSMEDNKGNLQKDYKFLVQKLKIIKEIIVILEKNLLGKEI